MRKLLKKALDKVVRPFRLLRARLPSKLPQGRTELLNFCKDIFDLYGFPLDRSYRHCIATMVLHLPPTKAKKSKHYFAVSVRKTIANQVAYAMVQEINKEAEKEDAEKAAKVGQG